MSNMFNRNDFLNWAQASQNSGFNHMRANKQQEFVEPLGEVAAIAKPVGIYLAKQAPKVIPFIAKQGKEVAVGVGADIAVRGTKKVMDKLKKKPKQQESVEPLSEVAPLTVGAGAVAGGYGLYKSAKWIEKKQALGIEKRAQASASQTGTDAQRPSTVGAKRAEIDANAKAALASKQLASKQQESATWNYRKSIGAAAVSKLL